MEFLRHNVSVMSDRKSIHPIIFATTLAAIPVTMLFKNTAYLFFPLPILPMKEKRLLILRCLFAQESDNVSQSSVGSVKNKSVQACRATTGLLNFFISQQY